MRKVFLSIAAVAIVLVAAMNVNVSLLTEKVANISLADIRALAHAECTQDGVSLLTLSNYKMAITNSDKRGGVAIRNNNPSTLNQSYYGLDVEQNVLGNREASMAIRAYAVAPSSLPDSKSYGIHATAGNAAAGYNYGVFANLAGCQNGTALYATVDDWYSQYIDGRYAGYFQGNVRMQGGTVNIGSSKPTSTYTLHVSGNIGLNNGDLVQSSDSRYKTNVKNLGSSLEKIAKLRPVTYNLKPEDLSEYYALVPDSVKIESDKDLRKYFGLGKGCDTERKRIGFIAQEVQKIFPELIYQNEEGMLGVNYIALVPVLAGAIQEQNLTIQEQQKTIQKQDETIQQMGEALQMLANRLEALEKNANNAGNMQENNFSFTLFPNPASNGSVTVDYTMKVDAPIGIDLYNTFGQKLKVLVPTQNRNAGSYSVQISVSDLNPGTYIIRATSGNQVESKQLIIK